MVTLNQTAVRKMQDLSWQLAGCRSSGEVEATALEWLYRTLPCSYAALTDFTPASAPRLVVVPVDADATHIQDSVAHHFGAGPSDHPLVAHYFSRWGDLTPLRTSDLLSDRQLRATRVFAEVFRPFGVTHQIAMVNRRVSLTDNAGYTVMRQGRDFSGDDLTVTIGLQPILFAVHQVLAAGISGARPEVDRCGLTAAELEVLQLVSVGLTATAIAHLRRVSPRTVRKHLENVYTKLGRHDRLTAVLYARRIGLLIEPGVAGADGEVAQGEPAVTSTAAQKPLAESGNRCRR